MTFAHVVMGLAFSFAVVLIVVGLFNIVTALIYKNEDDEDLYG